VPDWLQIEKNIRTSLDQEFEFLNHSAIASGDISQTCRIDGILGENKEVSFFIKFNHENRLEMFQAEAAGLEEIALSGAIRAPRVICCGVLDTQSYLVLENLALSGGQPGSATKLGQQLAMMHKVSSHNKRSNQFGWSQNNTIGLTTQINTPTVNWIDFWREQRLGFQLDLAKQNGAEPSLYLKGKKLLNNLDSFFKNYEPHVSLLHGDLWSGNVGYVDHGEPVVFDPAVYYGDREADIAMTELFGGFPAEFYSAYQYVWPLHEGYKKRKNLYNLYHILNHYNLFGGGYAMQAEYMIDQLLRQNGI
jgi:fructosamine-3-kinase